MNISIYDILPFTLAGEEKIPLYDPDSVVVGGIASEDWTPFPLESKEAVYIDELPGNSSRTFTITVKFTDAIKLIEGNLPRRQPYFNFL